METLAHGIAGSVVRADVCLSMSSPLRNVQSPMHSMECSHHSSLFFPPYALQGGMVAMAILYPLDQIKTIMQVEGQDAAAAAAPVSSDDKEKNQQKKALDKSFVTQAIAIMRAKKWQVYQGHVSTQVALGGSNFVYFFCYNGLKAALLKRLNASNKALSGAITPMQNLALSCLAGVINVYITAPLWVMNMRLKSKDHAKYAGMIDCVKQIVQSEGLLSLWNGTLASLMLVSNPVIHYVSYERMKTALQLRRIAANPKGGANLSSWEIFVLGALAKSLTTVVTYPLQVAQSLMRVQAAASAKKIESQEGIKTQDQKPPSASSLSGCLVQIYKEQGVAGYFAGLEAKLLQTVLTAAISLVTYEKLLAIILVLMRQNKSQAIEKAVA